MNGGRGSKSAGGGLRPAAIGFPYRRGEVATQRVNYGCCNSSMYSVCTSALCFQLRRYILIREGGAVRSGSASRQLQARRTWPLGALLLLVTVGKRGEGKWGTRQVQRTSPSQISRARGMVCRPVTAIRAGVFRSSACRSGGGHGVEREPPRVAQGPDFSSVPSMTTQKRHQSGR